MKLSCGTAVGIDAVVDQDLAAGIGAGPGAGRRVGLALQPGRRGRQVQTLARRVAGDATHLPVAVGAKVDRHGTDVIAKQRQRCGVEGLDLVVGGLAQMAEHGQDDAPGTGMRQGGGERLVIARLRRGAEVGVVGDAGGARRDQALDRLGMIAPRPRPALQGLQADRVDRHDQKILGGRPLDQPGAQIRQRSLDRIEPAREVGHRHQSTQQRERSIVLHGQRLRCAISCPARKLTSHRPAAGPAGGRRAGPRSGRRSGAGSARPARSRHAPGGPAPGGPRSLTHRTPTPRPPAP